MSDRQAIGRKGEDLAAAYLTQRGCVVLERNVRTVYGEIDLVVMKGKSLAFVEVKTRTSRLFGYPETGITEAKMIHMINCAENYLQQHPEYDMPWQLDVISVELGKDDNYRVTWFENAS
ncbi:MAG: YraN family protein [Anaerolineaceae bacterium]|jgi:putative endonuclease|nr:YraN family protein [Anaerolineaceae bacterium]